MPKFIDSQESQDVGSPGLEPEMILIPAGPFRMGGDPSKEVYASPEEQPQHTVYLPDYYIAKTPVTNAQYAVFVWSGYDAPMHWAGGEPPGGKEDHPVVNVSWHDALAYCNWLAEIIGKPYRLPSEAEWEKGARGTDGRNYPWGNQWDKERCNSMETGVGATTPVGAYPQGASPYGLLDMVGNVWEWCSTLFRDYPYQPDDGREDFEGGELFLVVRGGSGLGNRWYVRCAYRGRSVPDYHSDNQGFRVAASPSSP